MDFLKGWCETHTASAAIAPAKPFETWNLKWGDAEEQWVQAVNNYPTRLEPEEISSLLPSKWTDFSYASGGRVRH